ncbi:hypothetical protein CGMCC3_g17183 [Colletotrichum fructicola]|nr:uncharacterized protein CGMCC3_g17183 [Colletotrichum fructicola]KAE9566651.1 hypothetical protein CGMCC3_g17183 [Colletotrichum fructicola]
MALEQHHWTGGTGWLLRVDDRSALWPLIGQRPPAQAGGLPVCKRRPPLELPLTLQSPLPDVRQPVPAASVPAHEEAHRHQSMTSSPARAPFRTLQNARVAPIDRCELFVD